MMSNSVKPEKKPYGPFKDDKGNWSMMRCCMPIGLVGGLIALVFQASGTGACEIDLELAYVALFGGIFGGKAYQRKQEG